MQKTQFQIDAARGWLKVKWWLPVFLASAFFKTFIAFQGQDLLGNAIYPILSLLHKITVFSGLVTCWFGLDMLVRWFMVRKWFVWLSAFSFMIYAMHAPLVAYLINPALLVLKPIYGSQFFAFLLLPLAIIILIIGTAWLIRKLLPSTYSLLTGGRGF
jgi:hypothetical protein